MRAGGERSYRVIEQVTGRLFWENEARACGALRGQPVWIEHVHGDRQNDTVRICVSLEERPIALGIHRRGGRVSPARELKTGVTAFDDEYVVWGDPAEVVQQVLDLQTLDWVWRHYHGQNPELDAHGGLLKVTRDLPNLAAESTGTSQSDTKQTLYDLTTGLQDLAGRLVAAYDQAHRHVAAAHGDAAAAQWARLHAARAQELEQQRSPGTSRARELAFSVGVAAVMAAAVVLWLAL